MISDTPWLARWYEYKCLNSARLMLSASPDLSEYDGRLPVTWNSEFEIMQVPDQSADQSAGYTFVLPHKAPSRHLLGRVGRLKTATLVWRY